MQNITTFLPPAIPPSPPRVILNLSFIASSPMSGLLLCALETSDLESPGAQPVRENRKSYGHHDAVVKETVWLLIGRQRVLEDAEDETSVAGQGLVWKVRVRAQDPALKGPPRHLMTLREKTRF